MRPRDYATNRLLHFACLPLLLLALAGSALACWFFLLRDLPNPDTLPQRLLPPSVRITDRHGRLLYERLPAEGGRHTTLAPHAIPECLKQATIAVEDRNFYHHPGVDLTGLLRALWINLRQGEIVAGGSTITQQVVRNLLLNDTSADRSLRRKLREIILAWQLSRHLSKDEILALYLNYTYYGGLAYGIEAAAQTFFGKPATELTLAECALLAGLPQAPALYNPFTHPEAARQRQRIVLDLMEKNGFITPEERALAEQTTLRYAETPYPIRAPHFVWMINTELDRLYAAGQLSRQQGLIIRTTLDLHLQDIAEQAIQHHLTDYRTRAPEKNVNNAALVALDPRSGQVLALVGSADYFDETIAGAVNMAIVPRQPGSAFKPFLYAQALDPQGPLRWTAATPLLDVSTTFLTHDGKPYTPKNYDGREHGPVPLREALASSLNIPAVITLHHVGIANTVAFARRLGITTLGDPNQYDLSLALGGGEISLLELTAAYAVLANGGYKTELRLILDIHTPDGSLLYEPTLPPAVQVLDPRVAWLLSDILSDDQARALGFGRHSTLQIDRPAAVKTGTTSNFHDNWTIGYTPDLVIGVWVGNSNYKAMKNVTGLTGAAPIWHEVIRKALQGQPKRPFLRPPGLIRVEVCVLSGLLPTPLCEHTRPEWFITGTEPTTYDTIYRQVTIDALTGALADESTPPERRLLRRVLDLPPIAHAWARANHLPLLADLPTPLQAGARPPLQLISPPPNATYRRDPSFPAEAQQLLIEIAAESGIAPITIWVDDQPLITLYDPPYRAWWPLTTGHHRIWAAGTGPNGQPITTDPITITVTD